jgi:hypothetical protein
LRNEAKDWGRRGSLEGHDEIRLVIPATPEFVRLARLTVAGIASRMGFSFDEVEDLRIAIDELCYALMGVRGAAGNVALQCSLRPDALAVEGRAQVGGGPLPQSEMPEFSRRILDVVVDEYKCPLEADEPGFRLLKKRLSR